VRWRSRGGGCRTSRREIKTLPSIIKNVIIKEK